MKTPKTARPAPSRMGAVKGQSLQTRTAPPSRDMGGWGGGRPGPGSLLSCLQEAASRRTRLSPQIRTLVRTDWGRGKVGAEFSSVFLVFFLFVFIFVNNAFSTS